MPTRELNSQKPFSGTVTAPDYNGIKLSALVTGPMLSGKKMHGWNVERSLRGQL